MYTKGPGIGVRPVPSLPGTFVLNAKSDLPACFYLHFRLREVSRPRFTKVDQSKLGVGPKYTGDPPYTWYIRM